MTIEVLKPHQGRVYLDHNATTPPLVSIANQASDWLNVWGNPSSIHWAGRAPKTIVRETREQLATALGCHPLELVFTSGGTESNNLVLRGTFDFYLKQNRPAQEIHFISSTIEHPSVKKTLEELERMGAKVTRIGVSREGIFDWDSFVSAFTDQTVLVSMMAANNETGTLLPLAKIVKHCQEKGVRVHTDAVQALGKLTINLQKWGVDYASFSAHKFHALKGSGWLYVKKNAPFVAQITGGGQERHRRGGTENIFGLRAIKEIVPHLKQVGDVFPKMTDLRNYFETRVRESLDGVSITALNGPRLPNTSSLVIQGIDGETLLMRLDLAGYAVSTGAACSSGSPEPSPVLMAMGLTRAEAQSSLRVSFGWENTTEDVEGFVDVLKEVVTHLRSIATLQTPLVP